MLVSKFNDATVHSYSIYFFMVNACFFVVVFLFLFFFAVNHKNEDELMRSFNRTAQRKILSRLQQTRPEQTDSESNMLNEQLQARLLFCPLDNGGKN